MYVVEEKGEDDDEEECEEESSEEDMEEDLSMTEEPGNDSGCTAVVALLRGQLNFHLRSMTEDEITCVLMQFVCYR